MTRQSRKRNRVRAPENVRDYISRIEKSITVRGDVLSRPGGSAKPLNEQEYWILDLFDWTGDYDPCFVVQQSCGKWSEVDRQFMLDQIETERWPLLIDAEPRYEARMRALMNKGYIHSDMEF